MLTKNELKYYSSLLNKKHRDSEKKFIIEGKKIIEEALAGGFIFDVIFATFKFKEENEDIFNAFEKKKVRVEILKSHELSKLTDTVTPQGIAAVLQKPPLKKSRTGRSSLIVFLDDISDPGNTGTILRNCDWFGIEDVILSNDCADVYNPKAIRSSMGSLFHLNIIDDADTAQTLSDLKSKGYQILCSDLIGEDVNQFNRSEKSVVIFSNEAAGPSAPVLDISDKKISIPKIGRAESLNVASASAVILAQLTKPPRF